MNYEQKYKEALGWMRSIYPTMQGVDKEDAEHYFPELRESEDERNKKIKKEIIEMLHYYHSKSPCFIPPQFSLEETLAWLEKQGEKTNPYSGISFEYNGHIWGMCAREGGVDILCDSQLIKHIENQGEQKPADNVDVLMSLDEAIEHCKEKSCGNNACALEHKQLEKWLTELKELKEQNSSWSEEDEGMIECIIAAIKMGDYYTQDELNRMTSWLKSLKPNHWKPSQKQMEALKKECLAHSNYQLCRLLEELGDSFDIKEPFNWQSFRAGAAKEILCAMIPNAHNIIGPNNVEYAIMIADELIKQLKEKEEKNDYNNKSMEH